MIENYKPKSVRSGRQVPTGGFEKLSNGRIRPKTTYKEFFQLPDGREIEILQWKEEAVEAVKADGLTDLYEAIKFYVSNYAWLKKGEEVEVYAMECLLYGSYKHWKDFTYEGKDMIV